MGCNFRKQQQKQKKIAKFGPADGAMFTASPADISAGHVCPCRGWPSLAVVYPACTMHVYVRYMCVCVWEYTNSNFVSSQASQSFQFGVQLRERGNVECGAHTPPTSFAWALNENWCVVCIYPFDNLMYSRVASVHKQQVHITMHGYTMFACIYYYYYRRLPEDVPSGNTANCGTTILCNRRDILCMCVQINAWMVVVP